MQVYRSYMLPALLDIADVFYAVGGWWQVEKFDDITGAVSIEIGSMQYLQAQDNGLFIVGPQHNIGTGTPIHQCYNTNYM